MANVVIAPVPGDGAPIGGQCRSPAYSTGSRGCSARYVGLWSPRTCCRSSSAPEAGSTHTTDTPGPVSPRPGSPVTDPTNASTIVHSLA